MATLRPTRGFAFDSGTCCGVLVTCLIASTAHAGPPQTVIADRLAASASSGHTVVVPVDSDGATPPPPGPPFRGRSDCNGNGIEDACDVACGDPNGPCNVPGCGQSLDCQPDGIPDECQLYGFENVYLYDDGTAEYGLRSEGTHLAWMNRFVVAGDAKVIDAVELTYVNVGAGFPAMVYLWSDPDGDGNPTDARVLASAPTTTVNMPGGVFRVDLPNTYVGEAGTSFFVGTILAYPDGNAFPCPLDATAPTTLGVSWIVGRNGAIDPNDLANGAIEFALVENAIGVPMNVVVRAVAVVPSGDCNLNDIPDDCDIAAGTSDDVNGNGVPDECEDCNGNGIPDDLDIAGGASLDCQEDGIPDECQLDGNDCNADGIPDDCQLAGNDCNGNGVPDDCDLAGGGSPDANGNGVPDECEDCNGNGVPDEWDVDPNDPDGNGQVSGDCQPDGIPDECQWGTPTYESYAVDDGTMEATLALGSPGDIVWLNHFTVQAGMETIRYVDLVYTAEIPVGTPVTIYLWSDPTGDGDPSDAVVVSATSTTVPNSSPGAFNPVDVGDTYIGPAGTSFFVGAFIHDDTGFLGPITRDTTDVQGESWFAAAATPATVDPGNLGASEYFGQLVGGFAGNCLIRARAFSGVYPNDCNQNQIPDECDIASGFSDDLDGNGVPDECEDCNGNGIPDTCDISCDGPCAGITGCGQSTDCDGNGVPDECDILGSDCNGNGIPDTCDVPPLGSFSQDCNGDLIPDECQLAGNDCNGNGVPDECDLGGPAIPQYAWDDGTAENSIGLNNGGRIVWLNHFVTEANGESIKGVRVAFANIALGTNVNIYLWSDPDGDGDPTDAQVIASTTTTVVNPGTNTLNFVALPETVVGPAGTSFFVGARVLHDAGELPASLDQSSNAGQSWLAAGATVNPNNLSAASLFGRTGDFGFPGNWLVRAVAAGTAPPNDCNGNGIPDECDLSSGTSEDCNGNGVPDECDVPPLGSTSLDCNGNLVPDECEVAAGKDCDGNGIPDDCQPEDDCDDNGLLDSCEAGTANGLAGQYWRSVGGNGNFSQRLAARIDPTVDFDWGGGVPHPDVPSDDFTVRWTGLLLTPPPSGQYILYAKADDGVRLWINGELLIDEWHASSGDEYASAVTLLGNYAYHIRLEYYEGGGDARVFLKWSPPGETKQIIPTEALQPLQDCNGNGIPDACDISTGASEDANSNGVPDECEDCNGNGVLDEFDVSGGTSADCNGNGLPDECEVVGGGLSDCNGNGTPDDCELEVFDCDENGVHDACQLLSTGLVAQYFDNETWSGPPAVATIDATIDFPNPFEPPPPLGTDRFSVRWTGALIPPTTGTYTLIVEHDDGFTFYLNGTPLMSDGGSSTHSVNVMLEAGIPYHLRLDYFEHLFEQKCLFRWIPPGGVEEVVPTENLLPIYDADENDVADACEYGDCNGNGLPDPLDIDLGLVQDCDGNGVPDECQGECDCDNNGLLESCEAQYAGGLVGQYWSSAGGAGNFTQRLLTRVDTVVDFNWGGGSPDPLIPDGEFSVRWTGTVTTTAAGGTYTFYTTTDDGARLWVDGQLLIDEWHDQSPTEHSGTISLAADTTYLIRMDYREDGGGAEAHLSWQPPGGVKEIIPTTALGPMADADGDGVPDSCTASDCNNNGVPDLEDIAVGTSEDCNGNCIPDECDILPPPFEYGQAHWRFEEAGGSTVVDSSANALDGATNGQPTRIASVAVDPVPQSELANTQSLDLNWQSTSSGGFFTVPDTGGALSMGNQNFTIEAWVQLDHLSNTSDANQRQYLCQKKPLPSSDALLDYAFLVQRGENGSPSPNFGKSSGFTGRELQLVFGTGSTIWSITSNLQIGDLQWHFISVTYDTENNVVRFGIDDTFENISFTDNAHTTNTGPLRVASHQNGQGADNFFIRGRIDEMRISRGAVPIEGLLGEPPGAPHSQDADGNGIPDECAPDCPGDVDGDLDVDLTDLAILLSDFDCTSGCVGDVDGDDDTDLTDLALLLANFDVTCGP